MLTTNMGAADLDESPHTVRNLIRNSITLQPDWFARMQSPLRLRGGVEWFSDNEDTTDEDTTDEETTDENSTSSESGETTDEERLAAQEPLGFHEVLGPDQPHDVTSSDESTGGRRDGTPRAAQRPRRFQHHMEALLGLAPSHLAAETRESSSAESSSDTSVNIATAVASGELDKLEELELVVSVPIADSEDAYVLAAADAPGQHATPLVDSGSRQRVLEQDGLDANEAARRAANLVRLRTIYERWRADARAQEEIDRLWTDFEADLQREVQEYEERTGESVLIPSWP